MNAGLFFNPQGRITKSQFQTGALVLIAIGFVLALIPLLAPGSAFLAVSSLTSLIGFVTYWCWIALWVKRLHQGGQTGWLTVMLVLGWIFVSTIVSTTLTATLAPDMMAMSGSGRGDFMEMMRESMAASREIAIPAAIAAAIVSLVYVFVVNLLLPSESGENRFGPAPH